MKFKPFTEARDVPNHFWFGILEDEIMPPILATITQENQPALKIMFVGLDSNWKSLVYAPVNGNPDDCFKMPRPHFSAYPDRIRWGDPEGQCTIHVESLKVSQTQEHIEFAAEVMKNFTAKAEAEAQEKQERSNNMKLIADTFQEGLRPMISNQTAYRIRHDLFRDEDVPFRGELSAETINHLIGALHLMKQQIETRPYGK